MMSILSYLFLPNPARADYGDPWVIGAFAALAALVAVSFLIRYWRAKIATGAVTKKLSRSWSSAAFWFGVVGLVLLVSRVEKIQFVAMRFLWVFWGLAAVLYVFLQWRIFASRHYEVLPTVRREDPRAKYLPKAKK